MSIKILLSALFSNGPFFDGGTVGFQGVYYRHIFMVKTIHKMAQSNPELKMLEVGSWIGSSALTWSEAIEKYCAEGGTIHCVDPWTPYFSEKDILSDINVYQNMNTVSALDLAYNLFLHNIQFAATGVEINHSRGTSSDVLPDLATDSFDIIYLDGSHYLEDVRFDLAQADRLLKDGGILCGDDLELMGSECDLTFAKKHPDTDFIEDPKTGKEFHPGVTVAVHEMFPKMSSYSGYWLMQKIDGKYHPVDLKSSSTFAPSHFPKDVRENLMKKQNNFRRKIKAFFRAESGI